MADDLWGRVKDFAYRNAPEWVQERINDRALINNEASEREYARGAIENSQRWPHRDAGKEQVEVREGRSDEVLRRYSEAIKSGQTQAESTITKPTDLESYRQEQAFHRKHNQTRGDVADTLDRAASARHRAGWHEPGSEQREIAVDHARNLIDHARNLREGDHHQQQDLGLSR